MQLIPSEELRGNGVNDHSDEMIALSGVQHTIISKGYHYSNLSMQTCFPPHLSSYIHCAICGTPFRPLSLSHAGLYRIPPVPPVEHLFLDIPICTFRLLVY